MDFVEMILNGAMKWYTENNVVVNWVGGILFFISMFLHPKTAKAAGSAFSIMLKGVKLIGKPLEKKTEEAVGAFYDGMRQDNQEEIKEQLKKDHPILNIEVPGNEDKK